MFVLQVLVSPFARRETRTRAHQERRREAIARWYRRYVGIGGRDGAARNALVYRTASLIPREASDFRVFFGVADGVLEHRREADTAAYGARHVGADILRKTNTKV